MSPAITRAQRQPLRLQYNAAYAAYRAGPVSEEANALRELIEERASVLAAMRDDP